MSYIRLWKLGDLDKGVLPTDAAFEKLASILSNRNPEQDLDILWGPAIEVVTIEGNKDDIEIIETADGKRVIIKGYDE